LRAPRAGAGAGWWGVMRGARRGRGPPASGGLGGARTGRDEVLPDRGEGRNGVTKRLTGQDLRPPGAGTVRIGRAGAGCRAARRERTRRRVRATHQRPGARAAPPLHASARALVSAYARPRENLHPADSFKVLPALYARGGLLPRASSFTAGSRARRIALRAGTESHTR
jgi:hypothetical protein